MTTKLSGGLRILLSLSIVVLLIVTGYMHRSPWTILLAAPAFTALYIAGKWTIWANAWRALGTQKILVSLLATFPIQAFLAGIFYLIGLGLSMLLAAPSPIAALSWTDVRAACILFVVAFAVALVIIRLEAGGGAALAAEAEDDPITIVDDFAFATGEFQLHMDPQPLTPETFFTAPGYWRSNIAMEAMEKRGAIVEQKPLAASEEMIAETETRLGRKLPETLRKLYRIMDGGYVGTLYVPLVDAPRLSFDDWRGAFSIDYSSLAPLDRLRTVAEHYEDFTQDPEDVPANADKQIILQARYGDMTLLDYSEGTEPRVLIVDYDRMDGKDPVDIAYGDFDSFFAALRREEKEGRRSFNRAAFRSAPLGSLSAEMQAEDVWQDSAQHSFRNIALSRADGSEPKEKADDMLVAETESRLGVSLPPAIVNLWRRKNGGPIAYSYLDDSTDPAGERQAWQSPVPLEYVVSLAELSRRIRFAPGERPWADIFAEPERLVVLEADRERAVLLDYRANPQDPAVLLVDDIEAGETGDVVRIDSVSAYFDRLRRHQRRE